MKYFFVYVDGLILLREEIWSLHFLPLKALLAQDSVQPKKKSHKILSIITNKICCMFELF